MGTVSPGWKSIQTGCRRLGLRSAARQGQQPAPSGSRSSASRRWKRRWPRPAASVRRVIRMQHAVNKKSPSFCGHTVVAYERHSQDRTTSSVATMPLAATVHIPKRASENSPVSFGSHAFRAQSPSAREIGTVPVDCFQPAGHYYLYLIPYTSANGEYEPEFLLGATTQRGLLAGSGCSPQAGAWEQGKGLGLRTAPARFCTAVPAPCMMLGDLTLQHDPTEVRFMSCCQVGRPAPGFCPRLRLFRHRAAPRRPGHYAGRWLVLAFYPRDFSFICPTELTSFARRSRTSSAGLRIARRQRRLAPVAPAVVVDTPAKAVLGPLRFPLAADPDGAAARAYGVWSEEKGVSTRGLFIVDPAGVLQYMAVHNLSVAQAGRCPAGSRRFAHRWTLPVRLDIGRRHPRSRKSPSAGPRARPLPDSRARGSGTFGSVFAAWDLRLSRMVALKISNAIFSSRARSSWPRPERPPRRFEPQRVHDLRGRRGGRAAADRDGISRRPGRLSTAIEQGLDRPAALGIAIQIARGLAAAHQEGVVHGDLKPANVILTAKGVAKIVDFGLSRPANAAGDAPIPGPSDATSQVAGRMVETVEYAGPLPNVLDSGPRRSAAIRGTPAYMAPEQARAAPATLASDVFSLR